MSSNDNHEARKELFGDSSTGGIATKNVMKDDFGFDVPSGIYFISLQSENRSFTKKIMLLK